MNGHVRILDEMIGQDPIPAREKVGREDTVMHLCVKHRQLGALQFLADNVHVSELVNEGDENGDTVFHLAVRYNQPEMIIYLLQNNKTNKRSRNGKGETALQILSRSLNPDTIPPQIREILKLEEEDEEYKENETSVIKWSDVMMVVAILIATMAFQAAVSPPGGVWQEDSSLHKAGEAVMASKHPEIYKHFVRANTVAFVSSMTTIILLTINLTSLSSYVTILTLYTTWVSMASIAVSYGASMMVITPYTQTPSFNLVIYIVIALCLLPYGICVTLRITYFRHR